MLLGEEDFDDDHHIQDLEMLMEEQDRKEEQWQKKVYYPVYTTRRDGIHDAYSLPIMIMIQDPINYATCSWAYTWQANYRIQSFWFWSFKNLWYNKTIPSFKDSKCV